MFRDKPTNAVNDKSGRRTFPPFCATPYNRKRHMEGFPPGGKHSPLFSTHGAGPTPHRKPNSGKSYLLTPGATLAPISLLLARDTIPRRPFMRQIRSYLLTPGATLAPIDLPPARDTAPRRPFIGQIKSHLLTPGATLAPIALTPARDTAPRRPFMRPNITLCRACDTFRGALSRFATRHIKTQFTAAFFKGVTYKERLKLSLCRNICEPHGKNICLSSPVRSISPNKIT